ncbi:probable splicing factor 3A subunit 1 [Eutrema salsugineum]|uniref:probable splicing factor 3A subunit 1 n=1 Tax=Eutrema salsugineum TaxID=72664 RepID=UPI000CED5542|nr:probable splicing factor 3A subunit 1 [Eutrema salsugineum]
MSSSRQNDLQSVAQPLEILKCPEEITLKEFGIMKLTAQFVVRFGMSFCREFMFKLTSVNANNDQFEFIKTTDSSRYRFFLVLVDAYNSVLRPYYRNYQRKNCNNETVLEGFLNLVQSVEKQEEMHASFACGVDFFASMDGRKSFSPPGHVSAEMLYSGLLGSPELLSADLADEARCAARAAVTDDELTDMDRILESWATPPPRMYPHLYPKEIPRKQLGLIKLTAQFVVRYGVTFMMGLSKRLMVIPDSRFEFFQTSDSFSFFHRLISAYGNVLRQFTDSEEVTVVSEFFKLVEEGVLEMHASSVGGLDYFANREDEELTPHECFSMNPGMQPETGIIPSIPVPTALRSLFAFPRFPKPAMSLPENPKPKRQEFDEPGLVSAGFFLAQHSVASPIRVSVPSVDVEKFIEIELWSYAEKVATLKEMIAGEIQIPANKLKLSWRNRVLEDNRSLAYYNVGPEETLTLSY